MKHLFYCHYEYTVTPKKRPKQIPYPLYKERDYVSILSENEPTKDEIKAAILAEWSRKKIRTKDIYEIYSPEKIY